MGKRNNKLNFLGNESHEKFTKIKIGKEPITRTTDVNLLHGRKKKQTYLTF